MFYRKFLKPSLDFIVALIGFIILSPVFIIIVILLFIANGGKPFFFQPRPGVSRMNRIDSSFQCCIKDGSRSTAYAVQAGYANHLKVLYSKDMVLNVQAKGICKGIRYV